jgi:hypothetical protein
LYIYEAESRSVQLVKPLVLPWFITFYLCCFHKKHVFNTKNSGTLEEVGESLRHFCNRIRWQHHFRDALPNNWHNLRSRRSEVAPFSGAPDERLEDILEPFATEFYDACKVAIRKNRAPRNSRLYVVAMDRLRKSTWAAVPNDKDGGFCLVSKFDLAQEYTSILASAAYRPHQLTESLKHELIEEYVYVCKEAASRLGDEGPLQRALLSSLAAKSPRLYGKLSVTITTQQACGLCEVSGNPCIWKLGLCSSDAVHHGAPRPCDSFPATFAGR